MTDPTFTFIAVVLDRSGSMASVAEDTIGGYNTFVDDRRSAPGKVQLLLAQFDNEYDIVYDGVDIKHVVKLTADTYQPRGTTALLDAIGRTITAMGTRFAHMPEHQRPGKVILVIQTDGEENFSCEFSQQQIKDMITHQRGQYAWQVIFLGVGENVLDRAADYGISKGSALAYHNSGLGTKIALCSMSAAIGAYVSDMSYKGIDISFTDEQRNAAQTP